MKPSVNRRCSLPSARHRVGQAQKPIFDPGAAENMLKTGRGAPLVSLQKLVQLFAAIYSASFISSLKT